MPVKKNSKLKVPVKDEARQRRQSAKLKTVVKTETPKTTSRGILSVPIYSLAGKETGSFDLPKDLFGVKINQKLLVQALRVYLNNQKGHFSHTKTRGEVNRSTRKIYRQKGTGKARHGSLGAPIFVGGGVAHGPKFRKVILDLPKKMKKQALISALSEKAIKQEILGLSGLEKALGKTKEMAKLANNLWQIANEEKNKKRSINMLILADKNMENVLRSSRNIPGVDFLSVDAVNAYEVIKHQTLVLTKEAVEKLEERLLRNGKKGESKN